MLVVVLALLAAAEPASMDGSLAPVPGLVPGGDGCGWCACARELDDAAISDKRCRRPDWSCFDDPCASCAGLAWAPIRIGVAYVLLPMCLTKCGWNGEPDLDDIGLFLLFGVPMKECPRPNIPRDEPPVVDEPPISVMFY